MARRYFPISSVPGVYDADRAPSMSSQPVTPSSERAHCQVVPVTPPSGSDRLAWTGLPTRGWVKGRLTVPSCSTSVTSMVNVTVSLVSCASVAVTVTSYVRLVS